MDENTEQVVKIHRVIHDLWKKWAKDILTKSTINPDGSRTIPPDVVRNYVDFIMEDDIVALASNYEQEFNNIISTFIVEKGD